MQDYLNMCEQIGFCQNITSKFATKATSKEDVTFLKS